MLLDELVDEGDRPHLAHERGIEADLIDAIEDLRRGTRQRVALDRVDVNDDDILAPAIVDQGEHRRVAHIAAIPVMLAIDLDRLEQEGEATRGKDMRGMDLATLEDLHLAGAHIGGGEEELDRAFFPAQRREIDALLQHLLQRIVVERVEFIGREQPGHEVGHDKSRREAQRMAPQHAVEPARLQRRLHRRDADALPEPGERRLGAVAAPDRIAGGEDRRIHRAGAGRGNPLDVDPLLLEQAIEHAPGEGAMGPAALQGEIDRLGIGLHCPTARCGTNFPRRSLLHQLFSLGEMVVSLEST